MAPFDAQLTSDQEVAGLTPAGLAHSFLIMKYFLLSFSPFKKQEEQLLDSGKRMCTILFNA